MMPMRSARLLSSRLFGILIAILAAVVAIVPPLGYWGLGYSALASAVETTAQIKSEIINKAISTSPQMWRYEEHRLRELLLRFPVALADEEAQILSENGELIAASTHRVTSPLLVRTAPLFDSGTRVGQVAVRHSLKPLLLGTMLAVLLGGVLAGLLVSLLCLLRQREVKILRTLLEEQERARVALHAIGDAVITTDAAERIEYLNPVAERLMQWNLAAARGLPLSDVCCLVDAKTREGIPLPVWKALRDEQAGAGKPVALLRRDGSTVAVNDTSAPIHDQYGNVIGGVIVFHDIGPRPVSESALPE